MHFNLGSVLRIAARVGAVVFAQVPTLEKLSGVLEGVSGPQKRALVLDLIRAELSTGDLATGRDLGTDPDVLDASGSLIDAYVALHNVIARKTAQRPG
jgi:hypothetical protein